MQTVEDWLGWFTEDELRRYPALAIYGAWFRVLTGRPAEAERWLALADGATSAIPLSDGSATIDPWVAALRAHMMPNGVGQALTDAELARWTSFLPESVWRPTAHVIRGVASRVERGRPIARRRLHDGHRDRHWRPVRPKRSTSPSRSSRCSPPRREPGARPPGTRSEAAGLEDASLGDYGGSALPSP